MHFPILIVLHQEHSTPGRIGLALQRLGYPLDVRRPRFGETLPETMAEHSAAVIFGGPMSANDSDDFIRREIDWIGVPLRQQAVSRHLPWRADVREASRRQGVSPSRRPRRGRLLPGAADGGRTCRGQDLAGTRLSMAP